MPYDAAKVTTEFIDRKGLAKSPQGARGFLDLVEPMLGLKRGKGHCRNQAGFVFVSGDPNDTLLFPADDPRAGEDRYEWVEGEGALTGIYFGTLVELVPLDHA